MKTQILEYIGKILNEDMPQIQYMYEQGLVKYEETTDKVTRAFILIELSHLQKTLENLSEKTRELLKLSKEL